MGMNACFDRLGLLLGSVAEVIPLDPTTASPSWTSELIVQTATIGATFLLAIVAFFTLRAIKNQNGVLERHSEHMKSQVVVLQEHSKHLESQVSVLEEQTRHLSFQADVLYAQHQISLRPQFDELFAIARGAIRTITSAKNLAAVHYDEGKWTSLKSKSRILCSKADIESIERASEKMIELDRVKKRETQNATSAPITSRPGPAGQVAISQEASNLFDDLLQFCDELKMMKTKYIRSHIEPRT